MKYDSYRIKPTGGKFYYKVVTTETETDVYVVKSDGKGEVLGSLQIYEGSPMRMFEVINWLSAFLRCRRDEFSFCDIEEDKI